MAQTYRGEKHITGRELGRAGFQAGLGANALLDDDHNRVLQLFNQYEDVKSSASTAQKNRLAQEIMRELKIHSVIEEEIYYPRMREKADVDDRVANAEYDHRELDELIREIEAASREGSVFDEKMHELGKAVREHISFERSNLFDVAEVMGINTPEIARRLLDRKEQLKREVH